MSSTPLPEITIGFSPTLAVEIGLEPAILLQQLQLIAAHASASNGQHPDSSSKITVTAAWLHQLLPFWPAAAIKRYAMALEALDMISIDPLPDTPEQEFSITIKPLQAESYSSGNSNSAQPTKENEYSRSNSDNLGAHKIPNNWTPDEASITQLISKGVSVEFIMESVEEFVSYWLERGEAHHAWSNKFLQNVSRRWEQERDKQQRELKQQASQTNIGSSWQPSEEALEILTRQNIDLQFIQDAIAEFVLYWKERGEAQSTWNSKFVTHVKKQWARFTHTLKNDNEPVPMRKDWEPSVEVFEILAMANIRNDFAQQLVPEFIMYWLDKGELHHSWNAKFLQYAKSQWSKINGYSANQVGNANERHPSGADNRRTRDRSLQEDLNDTSWAT